MRATGRGSRSRRDREGKRAGPPWREHIAMGVLFHRHGPPIHGHAPAIHVIVDVSMDTLRDPFPPAPTTTSGGEPSPSSTLTGPGTQSGGLRTEVPAGAATRGEPPLSTGGLSPSSPAPSKPAVIDVNQLTEVVKVTSAFLDDVFEQVGTVVVGQREMVERVMIGLLTGGH